MKREERDKLLEELSRSQIGVALLEFINEKIFEMKDISKIKDFNEMLGKQEAIKTLEKIFSFLNRFRENDVKKGFNYK